MQTRSASYKVPDDSAMDGLEMSRASNTDGSALTTTPSGSGETGEASIITADLQRLRLPNDHEQSDFERFPSEAPTGSISMEGSPASADPQDRGISKVGSSLSEIPEPEEEVSRRLVNLTELGELTDRHGKLLAKGDSLKLRRSSGHRGSSGTHICDPWGTGIEV